MTLLNFFLSNRKKTSADIAKERLQIIVAERRKGNNPPAYLDEMRRELLMVVCKYIKIDPSMVSLQYQQKEDDISIIEFNFVLPDSELENEGTNIKIKKETITQ